MGRFVGNAVRYFVDGFLSIGRGGRIDEDSAEVIRPQSIDRYFARVGGYLIDARNQFEREYMGIDHADV